jgi:SAM-dependent methyltransferase
LGGLPLQTTSPAQPHLVFARTNMVCREAEAWRPPLFEKAGSIRAAIRRFLDLQAGSIWMDLREILPQARGTMVDVGCGAQPYRGLLSPDVTYLGIDTTDAKSHFGYEIPDTRYFQGDVWPIDDASANLVLCTETLEHVPEPRRLLAEAFRCLAPGGTLVLTVPFAARWHFIPHDYWRFTPSGLSRLMASSGFEDVRVYARGNALTVACYKVMALILRLAMPQNVQSVLMPLYRAGGLILAPLLLPLAAIANLSLRTEGGDDCLGYTALAVKPIV